MSNADKGAVGLIPALELASLTIRVSNAILRMKEDEQVDMGETSLLELNGVDIDDDIYMMTSEY